VYAITRCVILLLFVLTAQLDAPARRGLPHPAHFSVRNIAFSRIMTERVTIGDANWYIGIAAHGYERMPFNADTYRNWAFFPLFPIVLGYAGKATGEYALTGTFLSCLFFLPALILVHKIALAYQLDTNQANAAVWYLAAFPVSYFFLLPVTESLFLLLAAGSFYAGKRKHWWLAAIAGALASATRITGVLLLPTLLVLYWETYGRTRPRLNALWLLLTPFGLIAYMFFLHEITGNALAFKDVMVAWNRRPGFFLLPLIDYLKEPLLLANAWDFRILNFAALAFAIASGIALIRWRWWSMACFTLTSLFVMLTSGLLQSQARYVMVLFPAFLVAGRVLGNTRRHHTILVVSLILLCLTTILFCYGITFALA
jgi:Gpi18-like mannosyltransferase